MLKKLMYKDYRKELKTDSDFEYFYFLSHRYIGLQYLIRIRSALYLALVIVCYWIFMSPLYEPNNYPDTVRLIAGAIIAPCLCQLLLCSFEQQYLSNTEKFHKFFFKWFTLHNNKVISIKDWRKIKSQNKNLYLKLLSEESNNFCYKYSLELALMLKDVELIWCSVNCPIEHDSFAHAIIVKNGYVYDSNRRLCYKFEDYVKFSNLKVYKTWSYEEYSIPDFRATVREDFRKWCKDNNVRGYRDF